MERKGFKFYKSYWDVASDMNDSDFKEFVSAMCIYYFEDHEPTFSNPMIEKFFSLVKPNIDSNIKRQTDGAKGGRSPKGTAGDKEDATSDSDKKHMDNTKGYKNEKSVVNTSGYQNEKPVVNTSALSDIDKDIDIDIDIDLFKDVPAEIKTAMLEYQEWRISIGKPYRNKNAIKRAIAQLQKCAPDNYQEQNEVIYQALDGGHTNFVPLLDNKTKSNSKSANRLSAVDDFAKGGC